MIQATFQHKQLAFYFSFHQFSGQSCGHIDLNATNNQKVCDSGTIVPKTNPSTDLFSLNFERLGNLVFDREELNAGPKPALTDTGYVEYGIHSPTYL